MGDGGSGGDPGNRAQNINENLGKMLRLDVDSGSPYGIPPTNPYVGIAGNDEIWSIGMRNPWKFSFNRLNGDLWIADVGQDAIEEINKITSPLPNTGLNFGWNCYEANVSYSGAQGPCPAYASTVAPFTQYTQTPTRCSITGGYYYTGSLYPNFNGKYIFGDYCAGEIAMLSSTGTITWSYNANDTYSITTFGEDMNGELYVAITNVIYKIIDTSLGLNNFNKNGLSFYPNPAKTEIFIKNDAATTLSKVTIFDLTGKVVLTKTENLSTIAISDLAKGLYLIGVEDTVGNRYQSKLIVE
jgi:hypothetical protein